MFTSRMGQSYLDSLKDALRSNVMCQSHLRLNIKIVKQYAIACFFQEVGRNYLF